ncbi:MAG: tetratricopeptide repeat protein [Calditrichaceae bacterium]|nr:tetratricopeptide repeat protein [Calditrichaceae bacterium]MBN2707528.1 tetratricopeptide repeat protein [Calditrichaceae bacterium]RQV95617.1 MAG: tetratricopeptide repeat protein [Calditrichota bacterium]
MSKKFHSWYYSFFLALLLISNGFTQRYYAATDEYSVALREYVEDLLINFGKDAIDRERFLVQQIRMINDEIKSRVGDIQEIKDNYFERMEDRLDEVRELKSRVSESNSPKLLHFITQLEGRIEQTLENRTMDFKQQKVIEDAIQLLHIAEEVVQLDPSARLDTDPRISKGMENTGTSLVKSFGGDPGPVYGSTITGPVTIYDVYKEWGLSERVKYMSRWTDVEIIKNRLLRDATVDEKYRMLQREISVASQMFNYGFFDYSEKAFGEILTRYDFTKNLDDILFYKGESNYLQGQYRQAREDYRKLIKEYPTSEFIGNTYKRLMQIAYHFDDYPLVLGRLNEMKAIVSSGDPNMEEALMLAVVSAIKGNSYEQAVSNATQIPPTSIFYKQAQFVLGEAYAGANDLEQSKNVFITLLNEPGLGADFRFTILLKLGYLHYELKDYYKALEYFDQIGSHYSRYDRVLIGNAWSYYQLELLKEKEQDFSVTKKHIETLLEYFFDSDYYLEAKTLLGYINQLEKNVDGAIYHFDYVYRTKDVKLLSDQMNKEQESLLEAYMEADNYEKNALAENNKAAFSRAVEAKRKVRDPLLSLSYSDLSSTGVSTQDEVMKMKNQLDELDRLREVAENRERGDLVERIESLQLKILRAVNALPTAQPSKLGVNYFDVHPMARKQSVIENENIKRMKLREDTRQEFEQIVRKISSLDVEIRNAKARRDYKKLVDLELSRDRFKELADKLDLVGTQAYSFDLEKSNINLDHWSDYGAFGMANVNFAIRGMETEQITYMLKQVQEINDLLEQRKKNIVYQIELIENEITLMTRQVRRQERIREREELERQFRETYFDTHDSELDYNPDTTEIPKLQDETAE